MFSRILALIILGLLLNSCKKESQTDEASKLAANNQYELTVTSQYFSSLWGEDVVTKLSDLPAKGKVEDTPYSGFWYPEQYGGTNYGRSPYGDPSSIQASPLLKYDAAFYDDGVRRASSWEYEFHTIHADQVKDNDELRRQTAWFGHCNGFSAAASRHAEPKLSVTRNNITFTPTDIKALLAELYMTTNYRFLGGRRCEEVSPSLHPDQRQYVQFMDACEDINPGTMHVALANWIGNKGVTLVFDQSINNAVWNYPLYAYESEMQEISFKQALQVIGSSKDTYEFNQAAKKVYYVSMTLQYSDALGSNGEGELILDGNRPKTYPLQYVLETNEDGFIVGGEWASYYLGSTQESKSRIQHPDFLWIPLDPKQGAGHRGGSNPYLDKDEVLQLWAESVGYSSYEEAPELLKAPTWTDTWGQFGAVVITIDGASRGSALVNGSNQIEVKNQSGVSDLIIKLNQVDLTEEQKEDGQTIFKMKSRQGLNVLSISYNYQNQTRQHELKFYGMM